MAEITVTTGELKNKANELRQLNSQFRKSVEEMTSNEQQLMAMWDGDAKDAFHNAYNSDKAQMGVFYDTIEKYCQALEENAAGYAEAERKSVNAVSTRTHG